ncbi:MAG: TetR family transcriptional regulator [Xanthobacteraceae bacterium]|nr:TetR family transcriptional regulator [Xanthobacteraceae bacterium]QYK46205.1 MAG: TetR family transcriptional regulator [Xanthobacteraceae bacterium]HMN51915.1 TetR/AcrR family transcriptional regulator [Xanthobacteraceae bacterium]
MAASGKHRAANTAKRTRSPRAEEDRRSELIAISAKLFREKGYDKTTVRDISSAAGIQSGSWFYYFKTKHDILAAAVEEGMRQALAQIEEIAGDKSPPREKFRKLVLTHLRTVLLPEQHFIPLLLYEWKSMGRPERKRVVAIKDRYEAIWDGVIAELDKSGDWAMPTRMDRLFLFGALNWTAQWYRAGERLTIEQLAERAVTFCLRTPEPGNVVSMPRKARR